jgi:ADP-ribose pyrophosphatase YjhB (NUDIX family)
VSGTPVAAYLFVTDTVGRWMVVQDSSSPTGWRLPGRTLREDESPAMAAAGAAAEQTGLVLSVGALLTVQWISAGSCLVMVFVSPVVAHTLGTRSDPLAPAWRFVPPSQAQPLLHPLITVPLAPLHAHGPIHYHDQQIDHAPETRNIGPQRTVHTAAWATATGETITGPYPCCPGPPQARFVPKDVAVLKSGGPDRAVSRRCTRCGTRYEVRLIGTATQPQALEWHVLG